MRSSLIILILSLLSLPLIAQDSSDEVLVLTEEQAVALGLEQNISFMSSKIDLDSSQDQENYKWNNFLPSLSLSTGLAYSDTFLSEDLNPADPWTATVSGGITLPLGMTNYYDMKADELGLESANLSYEDTQFLLELSIRQQFYYLLANQANLDLQLKNIELAEKRYEQEKTNFQNGLSSELTMLTAQNSVEALRPTYQDTYTLYQGQVMVFQSLLALDLSKAIELDGELDVEHYDFDTEKLIDAFLTQRLDVQSSQLNIAIQENSLKSTKANYLTPSLSLGATWGNTIATLGDDPSWSDSATISMSMSVPIDGFIRGTSENLTIKDAQRSVDKSQLSLDNTLQSAEQDIRTVLMNLDGAWTNIQTTELSVELALKTYEMTEDSYNQGSMELLDLEDAQNKLLTANQDLLESRYDYLSGLLDLEYALNTPLSELASFTR